MNIQNIPKSDLKIEFMRGTGPGGQHKNKTDSACRITYIPSGISAYADERCQQHSKKQAMKNLIIRLAAIKEAKKAEIKKDRRNIAIHDHTIIRTYNYDRGTVKDHRTGKIASIKNVLDKGKIDLLK